jgi:hypothetical protein
MPMMMLMTTAPARYSMIVTRGRAEPR